MVDKNQSKDADPAGLAADDPFAELTRIMGFDPREPVRHEERREPSFAAGDAGDEDEDFSLDLEKELMGEFADDLDRDAPAASFAEDVREPDLDLDSAHGGEGGFVSFGAPDFFAGQAQPADPREAGHAVADAAGEFRFDPDFAPAPDFAPVPDMDFDMDAPAVNRLAGPADDIATRTGQPALDDIDLGLATSEREADLPQLDLEPAFLGDERSFATSPEREPGTGLEATGFADDFFDLGGADGRPPADRDEREQGDILDLEPLRADAPDWVDAAPDADAPNAGPGFADQAASLDRSPANDDTVRRPTQADAEDLDSVLSQLSADPFVLRAAFEPLPVAQRPVHAGTSGEVDDDHEDAVGLASERVVEQPDVGLLADDDASDLIPALDFDELDVAPAEFASATAAEPTPAARPQVAGSRQEDETFRQVLSDDLGPLDAEPEAEDFEEILQPGPTGSEPVEAPQSIVFEQELQDELGSAIGLSARSDMTQAGLDEDDPLRELASLIDTAEPEPEAEHYDLEDELNALLGNPAAQAMTAAAPAAGDYMITPEDLAQEPAPSQPKPAPVARQSADDRISEILRRPVNFTTRAAQATGGLASAAASALAAGASVLPFERAPAEPTPVSAAPEQAGLASEARGGHDVTSGTIGPDEDDLLDFDLDLADPGHQPAAAAAPATRDAPSIMDERAPVGAGQTDDELTDFDLALAEDWDRPEAVMQPVAAVPAQAEPAHQDTLVDLSFDDFELALEDDLQADNNADEAGAAATATAPQSANEGTMPIQPVSPGRRDPLDDFDVYARGVADDRHQRAQPRYDDEDLPEVNFDGLDLAGNHAFAPDIDTVDVSDHPVALADDLDLPELPYDDTSRTAAAYDDLDSQFDSLLSDMNSDSGQVSRDGRSYRTDRAYSEPAFAAASSGAARAASGRYQDATDDGYAYSDAAPQSRAAGELDLDGYDPDLDDELSVPDAHAALEERKPRRGWLFGGLIAGVAVIGGAGAFALSFGSSGSDVPVLVKADGNPIKIKPENPGGTAVPNQDSKVYDTVTDGNVDPRQDTLVTTAEEPVEMPSPMAESEDELAGLAAEDEFDADVAAMPKGEDRLEEAAVDPGTDIDTQVAAIAPRKVRTMVVKPDGTLVPREEEVVAAAPAAGGTIEEAVADAPASTGAVPAVPALAPAAAPDAAQPEQVAALAPAPTAAAASGAWAMQIASQPNEAAAQSSYTDLARRYGSVLNGKPVNIVKAEIAGKGTFWRVRVPAETRAEAITLCESYKSAGGNCFVSR